MSIAPKNKLWTDDHVRTAMDHFRERGYPPNALDQLEREFKTLVDGGELAGDEPPDFPGKPVSPTGANPRRGERLAGDARPPALFDLIPHAERIRVL
ncbi:MAG TPA: hypothetical protein VH684_31445 [Xanthobacteraceae bacterium]|jgi:hypothetical protein